MKRKKTIIAFCIQTVLLGLDYSLTFLTLWVYLGQMHINKSNQFYALVAVSYLLVPVFFSVPICRIADRYRNVRLMFLITNIAMVTGNLLYSLSFSPWCLVVGRVIAGCGIPLRSIMAGEIARCHQQEEITSVFSQIGMAYGFGFVAGPGINFVFDSLDVYVGEWHITFANVTGIYVAILFLFAQIMCFFLVHNLSKEYDLKAEIQKENERKLRKQLQSSDYSMMTNSLTFALNLRDNESAEFVNNTEKVETNSETEHCDSFSIDMSSIETTALLPKATVAVFLPVEEVPSLTVVVKNVLSNKDTFLMLVLAYFENFFSITFNMWLPMAVTTTLKWSMNSLNWIVLGTGVCSILPCLFLIFKKLTDRHVFWISTVCVGLLACLTSVYITLGFYNSNYTLNVVLWVIYAICFSNVMIIKDIFLGGFLAKMFNSKVQALGDSLRLSSQRVGAITALLLSPLLYDYMRYLGFVYIGIVIVLVICMVLRRDTLSNPKVIITC